MRSRPGRRAAWLAGRSRSGRSAAWLARAAVCGALAAATAPAPAQALDLERIGRFAQPVYVTAAPGAPGRLFVVERRGRIRVVHRGRVLRRPLLDIRDEVLVERRSELSDQRGMLSAAFASPTRFYVFFVDHEDRIRVDELDGARRRTLLVIPDAGPLHHGGQLALGPDGLLYVGVGFTDRTEAPQDPADPRGKILTLDPREPQPVPRTFASGLRNPYRFSFHRGRLYVADVGGDRAEEVTVLENRPGANLGWPVFEGRTRLRAGDPPGYVAPRYVHGHWSGWCSIVGGYVHRGRYFHGDLCTGRVYAGRRRTSLTVPYLVSFGRDGRGRLYAVSLYGPVYRVTP
ncbi:MAG TPA: PQQ-dependent sugar dehydrogenase [Solirubrobacteraceae bacterium]|nr:PQQ-dependent sugar dehydrogenase [Solirubrobacteraceae bacterium]